MCVHVCVCVYCMCVDATRMCTCAVEGTCYLQCYAHLCVPFGVCRAHIFGFDREVDGFYHHKERAKVSDW